MRALRIGITQRQEPGCEKSFARDALDAAWPGWFVSALPDAAYAAIPNFEDTEASLRYLKSWDLNALILSGGEDIGSSPCRDAVERCLLDHATRAGLPVLGVCRGMQMLQSYCGGALERTSGHVGKMHSVFVGDSPHAVNSWHRFAVMTVADGWQPIARAADGSIEAMRHCELPWLGIMWHPERADGGSDLTRQWTTELFALR